jgi:hypothetical protein
VTRAGYMGCLVVLGVLMAAVSCLAVFSATGAISTDGQGARVAQASSRQPAEPTTAARESEPPAKDAPAKEAPTRDEPKPEAAEKPAPAASKPAEKPIPQGTIPPKPAATGPEGSIAQRLDRETSGGGLKLRALGAAKTTKGDTAVLAIYVRLENDGTAVLRVDPTFFKLNDRGGTKYPISKAVEASLPAIDLAPRAAPGESGKLTEGNLTFEIPKAAAGLALTYEAPNQPVLRIPLPPEFG